MKEYFYFVFLNEYLVKLNSFTRHNASKYYFSILRNPEESFFYEILYRFLYKSILLSSILFSFFRSRVYVDKAFFYSDDRRLKHNKDSLIEIRCGVYNFFRLESISVYQLLPRRVVFKLFFFSLFSYFSVLRSVKAKSKESDLNVDSFMGFTSFCFARYFDLILFERAASVLKVVHTAGHFDVYVSMLSLCRKRNCIGFLKGYQHGVYEVFSKKAFPLYFDEYCLKYKESKKYFSRILSDNPNVSIFIEDNDFFPVDRYQMREGERVLAYAMQNDDFQSDLVNIRKIIDLEVFEHVIVYVHPLTSEKNLCILLTELDEGSVFLKKRHSNINYVVSRYSSMVLDYINFSSSIKGVFVRSFDEICAFESENILIVDDVSLIENGS